MESPVLLPERIEPTVADRDLVDEATSGSVAALAQVTGRLLGRVRSLVRCLVPRDGEADDVAQTAMLEILRSLGSYSGKAPLERWADGIAYRTAMAALRSRYRRARQAPVHPAGDAAGLAPARDAPPAGGSLVDRLLLADLLGRLSEPKRTALVLKLGFGHSVAEIARLTDVPANTVRDRLRAARRELRALFDEGVSVGKESRS
jgi:RNA polymerase sigma-70 factor (ECF subfamily)